MLDMVAELKKMQPKSRGMFGEMPGSRRGKKLSEAERLVDLAEEGCPNSLQQAQCLLATLRDSPDWEEAQELSRRLADID